MRLFASVHTLTACGFTASVFFKAMSLIHLRPCGQFGSKVVPFDEGFSDDMSQLYHGLMWAYMVIPIYSKSPSYKLCLNF